MKPQPVLIDPALTYTKSEYARAFNVSRVTLDKRIRDGDVKSVQIRGTTLVLSERR